MSSGFITESEAVDIRKKRQEEWDRVRTAADPVERPEEPYDHRSLFDRLQEQKQKKDLEYEEAHKLKNMIKGLDDDEIDFLDLVDRSKLAADRQKSQEEEHELNDFRNRVATLQEKALDQKIATGVTLNKPKASIAPNKKSQMSLLQGVVVKKTAGEKRKLSKSDDEQDVGKQPKQDGADAGEEVKEEIVAAKGSRINPGLKCIGILPGLGNYESSSSDETSDSDSDDSENCRPEVKLDLLGRAIVRKEESSDSQA